MNDITERIKKHPARLQAAVVAAVALGTAFGLNWSGLQTSAIATFSAAVIALLLEPVTRPKA